MGHTNSAPAGKRGDMRNVAEGRGQYIFLSLVLSLTIVLVMDLAPTRTAQAKDGDTKDRMVSRAGQMVDAPDRSAAGANAFAGSGRVDGITTTDSYGEESGPVGLPGLFVGSVIGPDGRTRVNKTRTYPYRANAFLEVDLAVGGGTCTGWFIGPRTLMTAGHCVYDTYTDTWATAIRVYPGRSGNTTPYGSASACNFWSVLGWTKSHSKEYDYGAIMLPDSEPQLGDRVGWYGFFWTNINSVLDESGVSVYGYPGDKTYGTQWGMQNKIKQVTERRIYHNVDTAAGQSGSAVYEMRSDGAYANSIHAYAAGGGTRYNGATRITKHVSNNMLYLKDNPTCP